MCPGKITMKILVSFTVKLKDNMRLNLPILLAFFQEFFQGTKSVIIQIFIVVLIILLFLDQYLGANVSGGTSSGGAPCPPVDESQTGRFCAFSIKCVTLILNSHQNLSCLGNGIAYPPFIDNDTAKELPLLR